MIQAKLPNNGRIQIINRDKNKDINIINLANSQTKINNTQVNLGRIILILTHTQIHTGYYCPRE